MRKFIIPVLFVVMALNSCEFLSSLVHDDQVVAEIGSHKLYRSEVIKYLPSNVSKEDSLNLSLKYINSWATDILYSEVAESQLSKQEKDVSAEIEEYTRSLIKFRYEQHYINDRLDTLITEEQVQDYYDEHQSMFKLQRPVMRLRYVDILKGSPNVDPIRRLLPLSDEERAVELDSIARASAIKYYDSSSEWMDASVPARDFGVDYTAMLGAMSGNLIVFESEETGEIKMAYVFEIKYSGVAPLEFCEGRIRDMILNARKHQLLVTLEQDLLTDALENNRLVIY